MVSSCGPTATRLEITHNLDQIVEWNWQLKSADGAILTSGRVIAFTGPDAARRIVSSVAQEVGRAGEYSAGPNTAMTTEVARKEIPARTIQVRLMPTDFSIFDTRIVL